jgi:hypothetical protein
VLGALWVLRPSGYLVWSRTFLLGVGLTDLGNFGRHLGSKQGNSVFNGSRIGSMLTWELLIDIFLARAVVFVKNFTCTYLENNNFGL